MKYWWLEKYKNLELIKIPELILDINYFLTMPKNYKKQYEVLKDLEVNDLKEEELLILLYVIVNKKNIKDNKLRLIIEELLKIQDNSFPPSDYSLIEILDEIKNLKTNLPIKEKLENNNVAICYHCMNIFYVDKINKVNSYNFCVCPYCLSHKLYFDNDYIPMNYSFLKLANLYYHTSKLGCTFKNIQNLLKKNVILQDKKEENISYLELKLESEKILPQTGKIIAKNIYDNLMFYEENMEREINITLPKLSIKNRNSYLLIFIITIMEVLGISIYLKKINIITNEETKKELSTIIKTLTNYKG